MRPRSTGWRRELTRPPRALTNQKFSVCGQRLILWTRFGLTACGKERLFVARNRRVCARWEPVMKLGEEHCRDMTNGLRADPLRPSVGVMRRLRGHESTPPACAAQRGQATDMPG